MTRLGAHVAAPGVARADVAMPELMTIRRLTAHGTDQSRALATGFGPAEQIRPAGTPAPNAAPRAAGGPAAIPGETRLWRRTPPSPAPTSPAPTIQTPTIRRSPASRAAGHGPAARPGRVWGGASMTVPGGSPGGTPGNSPGSSPGGTGPAPAPAAASGAAPAGRTPAADVRRLTVAPPRITVAPQQPTPPPVPEVGRAAPAAASASASASARAAAGTPIRRSPGSSLVEATAHLFTSSESPVVRRATGDVPMTMPPLPAPPSPGHLPVPTGPAEMAYGELELDNVAGPADPHPPNATLDTIVDAVVERIERRVIDELERRGRRQGWGVR